MSQEVVVALIGTVPGILMALVALRTKSRSEGDDAPPTHSRNPFHPRETPPTRLRFAVVITAMAVVTAAVALALLAAGRAVTGDDVVEAEVDVPAAQVWTNSGIEVARGDQVEVTARGEVVHSTTHRQRCGPEGVPGARYEANVVRQLNHGALLGRIGPTGAPFLVGDHERFTASHGGALYLGVNDSGTDNNSGRFTAEVEVRGAEA